MLDRPFGPRKNEDKILMPSKFLSRISKKDLIYHFTSIENAIEIIQSKLLHFNTLDRTNDPFEFLNYEIELSREVITSSKLRNLPGYGERNYRYIRNQIKRLPAILKKNSTRIICFSDERRNISTALNPRMWAQYARNNSGCCLVLKKTEIQNIADRKGYLFKPVKYDDNIFGPFYEILEKDFDENLTINSLDLNNLLNNKIEQMLFIKRKDWSGENEIRLINREGKEFIDIRDALIGIICGCKIPTTYLIQIMSQIEKSKIQLGITEWKNGNGTVERIDNSFYMRLCYRESQKIFDYFCEKYNKINCYYQYDPDDFEHDFENLLDRDTLISITNLNDTLSEALVDNKKDLYFKDIYTDFCSFYNELLI